jgi:hypothetical protein
MIGRHYAFPLPSGRLRGHVAISSVFLVVAVASGCFTPDLGDGKVACGSDGACPPGYTCRSDRCWKSAGGSSDDMAGSRDMAAPPGSDLSSTMCTAIGTRQCADDTHSGVCLTRGTGATSDRTCPANCADGYCQPPSGAATCARAADCSDANSVCAPFVVSGAIVFRCAPALPGASGGPEATCGGAGSDATCKTGYCVTSASGNNNSACLFPCTRRQDCTLGSCTPVVPIVIEGVSTGSVSACIK